MALIRWEPFREMEILRRQMDQLFSDLTAAEQRGNSDVSSSQRTTWVPAVELHDNGSELLLRVEIPGLEGKDLDIQVTQDAVSIAGEHRYEKRSQSNGKVHSEFRYGNFSRVIPLPCKVQNQQVKADLKDGILNLTLPKLEQEQNKVFKVNLGQSQAATAIEAGNSNG
ncbi:Hsp20/alpha crystallin family protein [Nostocaceae cyanobacterium CENA357]|uniref:Hsp20/alpha crystallin family protein n=1 Tax=Atlanticothrix silvestris CENA357 TaxID=1725252 RepID=A0A8J7HCD4_9CYAN|nr:Hsp20/alpha crystallin family protein [Atlanticothrix silvestris]MBH8552957.1 Hsp20/alpha crystallin family protein [Atlanticothrix silvestris CENA357]